MGICYSSADGKRKTEWETGNDKVGAKLKKGTSGDFATFISKLSGGGGAAATAAVVAEEQALRQIPGRLFANGASRIASLYTQQGKKGTNQDAMIVWEYKS
ncbi:UNVERIFIED_CONTAM: putative protein phosphatase 2C 6 [Sesamum radiatum]|uniref:Uncharacterized protein n=1 Tax=Sesamum radiatum TaxID=300843 RepID=A0AAW2KKA9_SESRA